MTAILEDIKVASNGKSITSFCVISPAKNERSLILSLKDPNDLKDVERSLRSSTLGLILESNSTGTINVSLPKLTKEFRENLNKILQKKTEDFKNRIRDVRKDALSGVKKELDEDSSFAVEKQVQNEHDKYIKSIEKIFDAKKKEMSQ